MSLFLPWNGKKIWSGPWTMWVFFNVSYSKDILSAYFVAMKYEETPKRNELLPLNYAYCLLCMQVRRFRTRGSRTEVICLFSKLYPWAIDDVTTIPFAQVCFMRKSLKAVYSKITKLNIQKLFDVYRKLKASYSSTTIPQVAKWLSVIVWESVPGAKNCGQPIWLKLGTEVGYNEIFQKPLWLTSLSFSFGVTGGVSFFALWAPKIQPSRGAFWKCDKTPLVNCAAPWIWPWTLL